LFETEAFSCELKKYKIPTQWKWKAIVSVNKY
jgi:hypothetical protein